MNTQYVITLKNCAFFAKHGVMPEEERLGQRFYVDAVLTIESESVLKNDDLSDGVDYGVAFHVIEDVVTKQRYRLIEALAYAVGETLCRQFSAIRTAEIAVRKPSAPVAGLLDYAEARVVYSAE